MITMTSSLSEFIASHEGVINHAYLDTRGNVTCGCGQLVRKIGELGRYSWSDFPAALQDFATLQGMARDCKYGKKWPASRYLTEGPVRARMLRPLEGLTETIERLDQALEKRAPWYAALPEATKWSVVDMAFQLGVDGLLKGFPKFCAAMASGDWAEAARQSRRPDASDVRNGTCAERIQKTTQHLACGGRRS